MRLERLYEVEHFDPRGHPAAAGRERGFTPKELRRMLTQAPSETLILRPDPALREATQFQPQAPAAKRVQRIRPAVGRTKAVGAAHTP